MASLGTLAVNIVARTEKFTSGVKTAMSGVGRLKSLAVAAGPAIAAGIATAAASFVALARAEAQAIDRIGKFADVVNVSTESLMGLNHAAELNGVSGKMLETGLRNIEIRVSEAAQGTGEAAGALDELGLSAQKLNQLTADQKLAVIADAMQRVENHTDKVRIAADLFGSRNAELVNVLRLGSAGLSEMRVEAAELGQVLGRDQVAAVEASNDAVARQTAAWKGVKMQMSAVTAPFFTQFYNDLASAISVATGAEERRLEALLREKNAQVSLADAVVTAEERRAAAIAKTKKATEARIKAAEEQARLEDEAIKKGQESQLAQLIEQRETFGMSEEDRAIRRAQRTNVDPQLSAMIIKEIEAIKALKAAKEEEAKAEEQRLELAEKAKEQAKRAAQATPDLTARVAGSVDTYAAARRNLRGPSPTDKYLAEISSETAEQTELLREFVGFFEGEGAVPIDGVS